jgi:tRNA modification GTPase
VDTIYALASARGRAGIAVLRVSGPLAHGAARLLCGDLPKPRVASLRRLTQNGALLDEALVVVFEAGASFTGEDVVEFHVHGGSAVVRSVLHCLSQMAGLRQSEPGEFTRRALENGRLDLAQVEGLADLIDAETEAQRRQAMRILSGEMAEKVTAWRADVLRATALLEATIDFSEEDLPAQLVDEVVAALKAVLQQLVVQIAGYGAAERLREGFEVALVGPPNVGKSTLLNALARREAALTSAIAGTTRDVIEVRMDLGGIAVTLLDTAGVRETDDPLESAGIRRTKDRAQLADLRVFLLSAPDDPFVMQPLDGDLVVLAKADMHIAQDGMMAVSGLTGQGIDKLMEILATRLADRAAGAGIVVHARHRIAAQTAVVHLEAAILGLTAGDAAELCADEIRLAARALESLIGKVDTEELLGHIFGRFCIGK